MSTEVKKELHLEIAHVLFMDVVGFSKLLINDQSKILEQLNQLVRDTPHFREAEAAGKLIRLSTGDGIALVFSNSPEAPVECALEISKALKSYPDIQLRMGVHSGPINAVSDVNDRSNVTGAGINMAQRVMDCGDAGHILVSRHAAEDLEHYARWQPLLHDLGEYEVKHGVHVHVFNLYTDEVGNPQVPKKIKVAQQERATTASHAPASGFSAMSSGLDEFDLKLLDAVQRNNRLTARQLGEKICLSPAAVQRRLRRLRERKIIEAEVAVVSPDAVGRSLIAIVEVTLDTHVAKALEEFERAIQSAPEVMQGYLVTGNADFILLVTAKSMEDYNAFVLEFLSKKAHVKHFNTSVVIRRVKWGVALPTAPHPRTQTGRKQRQRGK
ncbi:MAG: Lrp/AsnC ligand binding domain-containing protein [Candidatus Udaeobacter sp.]